MKRRSLAIVAVCGGLAACSPAVPESGAGFNDYSEYQAARAAREVELAGAGADGPPPISSERSGGAQAGGSALDTARAALEDPEPGQGAEAAAAASAQARNSGEVPLQASPSNPAPPIRNNPGLSDEQDFDAVAERRGIEGDAARLAQARARYQVVEPQPLPERRDDGRMTPVEFALATSHAMGQRVYSRSGFNSAERAQRRCAAYATPDLAQADFLANGGPERDRLGLDPDGDGFVCGWSPAPFRAAVRR
jgi:hypothetical protein